MVAFRSQNNGGAADVKTVNKPTGTAVGDLLLFGCVFYGSQGNGNPAAPAANSATPPTGFTSLGAQTITWVDAGNTGKRLTGELFYRIADGSEGSSATVTISDGSYTNSYYAAYSGGVDPTTPVKSTQQATHTGQTASYTATWGSDTGARAGSLAVAAFFGFSTHCATPAGYTNRISALDGVSDLNDLSVSGTVSAPSGTVAADALGQNAGVMTLVILQPAATAADNSPLKRTRQAESVVLEEPLPRRRTLAMALVPAPPPPDSPPVGRRRQLPEAFVSEERVQRRATPAQALVPIDTPPLGVWVIADEPPPEERLPRRRWVPIIQAAPTPDAAPLRQLRRPLDALLEEPVQRRQRLSITIMLATAATGAGSYSAWGASGAASVSIIGTGAAAYSAWGASGFDTVPLANLTAWHGMLGATMLQ